MPETAERVKEQEAVAVFYATFHDHTRLIAERIAASLGACGFAAKVHEVREVQAFAPSGYTAAILAAPVHLGKHHKDMIDFVRRNRAALEQLPTAFISATLSEVGVEQSFVTPEQHKQSVADVQMMLNRFFTDTGWHPMRVNPVAGAICYTRYNFLLRFGMKQIAKKVGAGTDTSRDYDYTDWNALDAFVKEFAQEIRAVPAASRHDPVAV